MSETHQYEAEVVVVGGGIAGIVATHELLDAGKSVLLLDKDGRRNFGGLAKKSFGGVHMIDTPHQRKLGIKDDPDKAYADWCSFADFGEADELPRNWARYYCDHSRELIFDFLSDKKIEFLPVVNWPERGMHRPGNSVPRWHIAWGTGFEIIDRLVRAFEAHPRRSALTIHFEHEVNGLERSAGRIVGVRGRRITDDRSFLARGERVVLANGGICGGDLSTVRANWYAPWGEPPELLLNGAHRYGDGLLHEVVREAGGKLTHLDKHWHYAAGVPNPKPEKPHDGLSLVPPRSALWFNALGERIMNPGPLVAYTDTRHLVASILRQPGQYSWQVLNWKIAIKELAVSGCDYMTAFRFKKRLQIVKDVLLGNSALIERLLEECPDNFVVAQSLDELAEKMTDKNHYGLKVDPERLTADVRAYDEQAELRKQLDDEALLVVDDGNHTFLASELFETRRPRAFISPTDFNCMGYAVPAAIGTNLANPDKTVAAIVGDGAFLMTGMELLTATAKGAGLACFVFYDGELSQISQGQEIPYNRKTCTVLGEVKLEGVALATGSHYVAITNNESIADGIREALEHAKRGQPVVVDVRIDHSKRTRFTKGVVKTNLKRFPLGEKVRFIGRALVRKVTG